jgi:hypothetical protein
LLITTKTADYRVDHVYANTGVSTHVAAALFAIEHGVLTSET